MLRRRCVERPANLAQQLIAHRVRVRKHADLDQFMAREVAVDFVEHRGAQAGVAYDNDRVQAVGTGWIERVMPAQRAVMRCRRKPVFSRSGRMERGEK